MASREENISDELTKSFLLVVVVQIYSTMMALSAVLLILALGFPLIDAIIWPFLSLALVMVVTLFIVAFMPKNIPINPDMIDGKPKIISKIARLYLE